MGRLGHWGDLSLWEEVQEPEPEPEHKTTERAICEYIVAQGDCAGVSCSGTLGYGMNKGTPCPLYEKGGITVALWENVQRHRQGCGLTSTLLYRKVLF